MHSIMSLHVGFVYVTDMLFFESIVTNKCFLPHECMYVCPQNYPTPKSSKITLRAVVKLNVPLCIEHPCS